ncbi:MAG: O-methyltransferase [Bacilli bacterium]|nr:O-methyltransferase [Bacilli bacterium]MDD4077447.1 O-methyltransferase [Bacilli bacterium]MDD4388733.1 O-methyltransferase [Bacilli bacterium]
MNKYIAQLNSLPTHKVIKAMRKYAETNKIPIINDEGLTMILLLVDLVKPKRFLEIGTAIGYCVVNLALFNSEIIIDTIEKNPALYQQALDYIEMANLSERINVYCADALDFDLNLLTDKYDIIFIDAAKAQYINYFELYKNKLVSNGIIITDNLLFHGLVVNINNIESKDLRHLTEKIKKFNQWLAKNKEFQTRFFAVGDGIAVSQKVIK